MPNILVIDDDAMITKLLQEFLTGEGHEVTAVHMGEEGVKKGTEHPPDLIICDVMLPDSTGFQLVDRFRQNDATKAIPIIMMTGAARHENQHNLGKMMGANEYVLKPFNVDAMGQKVQYLLEHPEAIIKETAAELAEPVDQRLEQGKAALEEAVNGTIEYSRPTIIPKEVFPPPVSEPKWKPNLTDPYTSPAPKPMIKSAGSQLASLKFMFLLLVAHICLSLFADIQVPKLGKLLLPAGAHLLLGWGIRLAILVALCAVMQITLEARQALRFLGWAIIPFVLQMGLQVIGYRSALEGVFNRLFSLESVALAEVASAIILGFLLRNQPGGNYRKSVVAMLVIALLWTVTSRGYFYP